MDIQELLSKEKEKLQKIDKVGRIYIPKDIRKRFDESTVFYISYEDGKIVLIPLDESLKN